MTLTEFSKDEKQKGKMTKELISFLFFQDSLSPHPPGSFLPTDLITPGLYRSARFVQGTYQGVLSLGLRHQNSTYYTERETPE